MRRLAKPLLFILALVPLAGLIFIVLTGRTSANPAEDILLTTGIWALRFLLTTLAITPVRRLTGWNVLIQYRRMLGLFAFFYATVHLFSYIAFDRVFVFIRFEEVRGVKEGALFLTDVDKSRLDAREHRLDPTEIDVADRAPMIRTIHEQLHQTVVFQDGHAGFPLAPVDQDLTLQAFLPRQGWRRNTNAPPGASLSR